MPASAGAKAAIAAFAVASLLAMLAPVTLALKTFFEWRFADAIALGTPRIIQTEPASAFVASFVDGSTPALEAGRASKHPPIPVSYPRRSIPFRLG